MRNIVESGEEMRFENEEIHFKNSLTIEGSVVYENCKIFCYEDGCEASIELAEDGQLTFRGCEVVFCGAKEDDEYFINSDGSLEMEDCKVLNANYFATGSESAKLDVRGCEFLNGVQNLFVTENAGDESHISDCKFLSTEIPEFIDMNPVEILGKFSAKRCGPLLSDSRGDGVLAIADCTVEFDADMKRYATWCEPEDSSIEDCTFVNDNGVDAARLSGYTTCLHCKFEV